MANHVVGIHHLDISIGCDIASSNDVGASFLEAQLDWLIGGNTEVDTFEIQSDVDDVLLNARNSCEFVRGTFDSESDNCAAADAGEQYAAQAVAERVAVIKVQRLNNKRT